MEVRQYSVFTFEELPKDIQEKAIDNLRDINGMMVGFVQNVVFVRQTGLKLI